MDYENCVRKRLEILCRKKGVSYYRLAQKSTVPLTTILHILDSSTKNPGIVTVGKLCQGLEISISDFFNEELSC